MTETSTRSVVAVKLRYNPKVFWFDPVRESYQTGDHVLVDTERGREIGLVVDGALEVDEQHIAALKSPLNPVIRALSDLDYDRIDSLDAKGREALPVFRELIGKHALDMKPISVEYLFSGDKAVFYFSSDERVDFRELVRELASQFHIRIDMRQIGVRDEARMLGGLAHCGEELCCARLGGEFQPVSIRMAKEQDLPLNPAKISGACGRLMCCLRYEFEAYRDFKGRAPKKGALIETPLGQAKVVDLDTPREVIHLRLEDGKRFAVALRDFDCPGEGAECKRPCRISQEAIRGCTSPGIQLALAALEREALALEMPEPEPRVPTRRPRRRGGNRVAKADSQDARNLQGARAATGSAGAGTTASTSGSAAAAASGERSTEQRSQGQTRQQARARTSQQSRQQTQARRQEKPQQRQRPGQRSSGIRGAEPSAKGATSASRTDTSRADTSRADTSESAPLRRRRRRASSSGNTDSGEAGASR
ncbi:MAG: hypothetical protein LBO07_02350 [Coriobacteriales bacterium]|jgi:cell fate regulator YaaT (PSP1 superfamily)|nr:hypothetical protein [Coriobacteriales bacterium]